MSPDGEPAKNLELPIIDIGPFIRAETGAADVVAAVEAACRTTGFFLVVGHDVGPAKTKRIYDLAREFFDGPEAEKRAVLSGEKLKGGVSFSPIAEEALSATLGIKTPGDIKQSLNYGPRLDGTPWPAAPAAIETAFIDYFKEMERLALILRQVFCQAIGLPTDYFEADFVDHLSALRVIDYPAQGADPLPGQLRAGTHTDYGFMTILRSEASSGGLQVQARNGDWIDAPSIDGAYVVNIGDAFMRWTNDTWVSTPHRVANPPREGRGSSRRQSIPFFLNPSSETAIECLPQFVGANGAGKYEPITFAQYIALKTSQAFGSK